MHLLLNPTEFNTPCRANGLGRSRTGSLRISNAICPKARYTTPSSPQSAPEELTSFLSLERFRSLPHHLLRPLANKINQSAPLILPQCAWPRGLAVVLPRGELLLPRPQVAFFPQPRAPPPSCVALPLRQVLPWFWPTPRRALAPLSLRRRRATSSSLPCVLPLLHVTLPV